MIKCDSAVIAVHYKPILNRFEKMSEHEAVKESDKETIPEEPGRTSARM